MNKLVNGELVTVSSEEETLIASEEAKVLADDAVNGYKKERTIGTATTTGYIDVNTQLSSVETFFEKNGNISIFLIIIFLSLLFCLIEFLISLKRYN